MSATIKTIAGAATATREQPAPSILDQILDRVDAIAVAQSRPSPIALKTWEDVERFAEKAARSGMVPKDYQGLPDKIAIAIQMGSELGLAPMQSLQNIAVIGNRPTVWGDAMPGLIRASGLCAYIKEWSEGEGEALTWHCESKRKDDPNPARGKFSVEDAKKAGLWQTEPVVKRRAQGGGTYEAANDSPWFKYPERMLKMRARGFCLRDGFPDVLRGLISAEEARDMVSLEGVGLTIQHEPTATPDPVPPVQAKRRTNREFLDDLKADLDAARTAEAVDAILAQPNVQTAQDRFVNGARAELFRLIQAALDRTRIDDTTAPDGDFPPIENDPEMAVSRP